MDHAVGVAMHDCKKGDAVKLSSVEIQRRDEVQDQVSNCRSTLPKLGTFFDEAPKTKRETKATMQEHIDRLIKTAESMRSRHDDLYKRHEEMISTNAILKSQCRSLKIAVHHLLEAVR